MKDGNQLTSKYSVELQVMVRRLDTPAFASGGLEPARAKATIVNLAAICIDQAMVGKAEAALGSVSTGQVQLVWWRRGRLRLGWGGAAEEFGGREVGPELIKEAGMKKFMALHGRPLPKVESGTPADIEFRNALDKMEEALDTVAATGEGTNMTVALQRLTLDIIGSTTFGVDLHAQGQQPSQEGNPLLKAAEVFFSPKAGAGMLLNMLAYGIPHIRRLLSWLAVKLLVSDVVHLNRSRSVLWGASQQLLDNARAAHGGHKQDGFRNGSHKVAGLMPAHGSESLEAIEARAFAYGRELCREATPPPYSIVSLLSGARNAETGSPLTDVEICSQLSVFLLAGYETTSLALGYALYELAKQPDLQAHVSDEVAALRLSTAGGKAGGEGNDPALPYEQLEKLPLTEAVLSEAMRMYPPVSSLFALAREANQPTSIGGFSIPAGTTIMFNVWSLHRDPEQFPDPEVFRPERFLPGSEEAAKRHPYAYIPFGVGPRKCIGQRFALEEGVLALARLVHRFEFSLDLEHHKGPLDLITGITLLPKGGIWLRVRRRGQ
ncbi:hypothetical protein N2152v2_009613 [Parachlorella kessleri]